MRKGGWSVIGLVFCFMLLIILIGYYFDEPAVLSPSDSVNSEGDNQMEVVVTNYDASVHRARSPRLPSGNVSGELGDARELSESEGNSLIVNILYGCLVVCVVGLMIVMPLFLQVNLLIIFQFSLRLILTVFLFGSIKITLI